MLYIVDGTGPQNDSQYRAAMEPGHCRYLHTRFYGYAKYFRGPAVTGCTDLGIKTQKAIGLFSRAMPVAGLIVEDVFGISDSTTNQKQKVLNEIKNAPATSKIYLCGYSRGGATVVSIAHELNRQGRAVEAMFLFDPVDSDSTLTDTDYIPPNVLRPFMAYRDMTHVRALDAQARKAVEQAKKSGSSALIDVLTADVIPALPSVLPIKPVAMTRAAGSVVDFGKSTVAALSSQWRAFRWSNLVARDLMFQLCVKGMQNPLSPVIPWKPHPFSGTHGAMGGCVWPQDDYPSGTNFHAIDQQCEKKTREWLDACIVQTPLVVDSQAGA